MKVSIFYWIHPDFTGFICHFGKTGDEKYLSIELISLWWLCLSWYVIWNYNIQYSLYVSKHTASIALWCVSYFRAQHDCSNEVAVIAGFVRTTWIQTSWPAKRHHKRFCTISALKWHWHTLLKVIVPSVLTSFAERWTILIHELTEPLHEKGCVTGHCNHWGK